MSDTSIGADDGSSSLICASFADAASAAPNVDRLKGAYQRAVVAVEGKGLVCNKLAEWEQQLDSTEHRQVSNHLGIPPTQWEFVQDQLGAFARELARLRQDIEKIDLHQTDATRQVSVTQAEVAKESMNLLYQLTTEQKRSKEAVERERGTREEKMEQLDARLTEALGVLRADLQAEGVARKEADKREIRDRANTLDQVIGIREAHEQEVQDRVAVAARLQQTLEQEVRDRSSAVSGLASEVRDLRQALEQEMQDVRRQITAVHKELEQEVNDRGAADTDIVASMERSFEQAERFQQEISGKAEEHAGAIQQLQADTENLRKALSVQAEESSRSMQQLREEDAALREAIAALRSSINQEVADRGAGDAEATTCISQLEVRMNQTNETLTMLTSIFDRLRASFTTEIQMEVDQRLQAFSAMATDLARVEQQICDGEKQASSDKAAAEKRCHALQLNLEELDAKMQKELTREVSAVRLRQHTELENLREQFAEHGTSLMEHKALVREDRAIYVAERAELEQKLRGDLSKVAAQVAEWSDVERRLRDDFKQMSMSKEAGSELEEQMHEGVRRAQAMHSETLDAVDVKVQKRIGELSLAMKNHSDDVHRMRDLLTERGGESFRLASPRSKGLQLPHGERSGIAALPGAVTVVRSSSSTLPPASARRVMEVLSESPRDRRPQSASRGGSATPDAARQASGPQPRLSSASLVAPATSLRRQGWEPGAEQQRANSHVPAVTVALPSNMALTPAMAAAGVALSSGAPSVTVQIQRAASGGRRQVSPLRRLPAQGVTGHPTIAGRPVAAAPT